MNDGTKTKVLQKRKKPSKSKNDIYGKLKITNRTVYVHELFREFNIHDLDFLQKIPIKTQIRKLKQMLKLENIDDETMENVLPDADSFYVEDVIKTDIFSTGIKDFDALFKFNGILSGDIMEICGQPHSGKTLLIHTILVNILKEHKDMEVIYFDSGTEFQMNKLMTLLKAHGLSNEDVENIVRRVSVVQITSMFDLLHALQQLFDPQRTCEVYRKNFNMSKIRFIVINTLTVPFYHISCPVVVNKKVTSDLHKTIHRLSKYYGITFFITNLALHKYKISESDKGDDVSSIGSTRSTKDFLPVDDVKAALDEFWPEILDHRLLITAINTKCDILGYVEISKQITLVESRHEKNDKSIIVKITDLGMI